MRLICTFLFVLILAGCWRSEPISQEAISWANAYYAANPVASVNATAGGWLFRGAREQRGELRVGYLIPEPMSGNANKRRAILELACPARSERIWQLLRPENELVIIVWTRDNKFKDSVTC